MILQSENFVWEVIDPQGRKVVLKQSTLEFHIAGADHSLSDSDFRRKKPEAIIYARAVPNQPI